MFGIGAEQLLVSSIYSFIEDGPAAEYYDITTPVKFLRYRRTLQPLRMCSKGLEMRSMLKENDLVGKLGDDSVKIDPWEKELVGEIKAAFTKCCPVIYLVAKEKNDNKVLRRTQHDYPSSHRWVQKGRTCKWLAYPWEFLWLRHPRGRPALEANFQ